MQEPPVVSATTSDSTSDSPPALPPNWPGQVRVGWLGDRAPPPWPLAWSAALTTDWDRAEQLIAQCLADPDGVLLFDARDLPAAQGLGALQAVHRAAQGVVPVIVLGPTTSPCDADWWRAGAFDCCDIDDAPRLAQVLARAAASVQSEAGLHAQLRRLRLSTIALRASLDNLPVPIFVKDAEGVYLDCNVAFQRYLGVTRDQVIGQTVHQLWQPDLARVYDEADRALLAEGGHQIYDARVRWADGSLRDVVFHKAVWRDPNGGVAGQAGAIFDVTDRKRLEHQLREQAETDPLTGLFNRRAFMDLAARALAAPHDPQQGLVLMLLDVDHFKQINDTWGHAAGDQALVHLARTLRAQLREEDLLARLGGDEFALLVSGRGDLQALALRLPRVVAACPLPGMAVPVALSISLGAAVIQLQQHDLEEALRLADEALYRAKLQGRSQARVIDARQGAGPLAEAPPDGSAAQP
ncbi:GGDEF domain-containing protein [Ideonella sp. A 288]|uniref:GGDEF domain-containing protein n=1 Tax=Ideonella sp. A 288 TaxID=1962181 RepID=UPI000B4AFD44|nr:GGDEF domain-containing protein [Ideonella sp. A 288]